MVVWDAIQTGDPPTYTVRDEVLLIKQWDSAGALARSKGSRGDDAEATRGCLSVAERRMGEVEQPVTADEGDEPQAPEVICYGME